ncbi:MAG: hypothetical protein WD960_01250 [Gemmatimonadota bacterium]
MNSLMPRWVLLAAGLALLHAGCEGDEGSHAVPGWDGESGRVEEVLRIGELDGTGPEVFGDIRALKISPEGDLLVFDHSTNELHRFARDGTHRSTFGGTGLGPGEFRGVVGIATGGEGEVWVVDALNARYTVIDPEGGSVTFPRSSQVSTRPWTGGFDREGRFHDYATRASGEGPAGVVFRVEPDGSHGTEFIVPRRQVPAPTLGAGVMVTIPFAPEAMQSWDPEGGVWQAVSSRYEITNIALAGDTVAIVSRPVDPAPLTPEEGDSLRAAISNVEARFGIAVDPAMRPETFPPLRWFVTDDEGRLWVCATGREPCDALDVFRQGTFLGEVHLPVPVSGSPLPVIQDGRFVAAVEGPIGEPQVFVGRLVLP